MAHALDEAARLVIERIASSDALYHNCEHTALVTLCVQDILRGRRLERTITPSDWGHTILAVLGTSCSLASALGSATEPISPPATRRHSGRHMGR